MAMRYLHRLALRLEHLADRLTRRRRAGRVIEPYAGYSIETALIVRGRVLTALRDQTPTLNASWLTNLREMVSLFLTYEVADVAVACEGVEVRSDEEGYFTIKLPRSDETGWVEKQVTIVGREDDAICPVHVTAQDADGMIISDIDDTLMETVAYSLLRNLWTSMTGNILTRRVYADAVRLLRDLSDGDRNPVFYVSSSPWNLYAFLVQVFARNDLPRAPMFLRELGLAEDKFITAGHHSHKGEAVGAILAANPHLPAILLGDMGQKDAAIYADVVRAYPGRIAAIVLRETRDGLDKTDRDNLERLKATDIRVFLAAGFPPSAEVAACLAQGAAETKAGAPTAPAAT